VVQALGIPFKNGRVFGIPITLGVLGQIEICLFEKADRLLLERSISSKSVLGSVTDVLTRMRQHTT
jgi:hypothetical protein